MVRSIWVVILGAVVGGILVGIVEYIGQVRYPLPADMDLTDPATLTAIMATLPFGALFFVLLAWAMGSLGGGWVAARLAVHDPVVHALAVGGLLLLAGLYNLVTIPSPVWLWIAGLAVFPLASYLGARLTGKVA